MAAVGLAALVLLGALAARHPGLQLVDVLSFTSRPDRLLRGEDWLNGLYPVGYPVVIGLLGGVLGDRLVAAKLLSVLAGAGAAAALARWIHPVLGAWLLAQPLLLAHGATEGTDMPAVALGLGAIALARSRPALAGAVLGMAVMVRYTAVAAAPSVLLLAARQPGGLWRALAAAAVTTLPHWGAALVLGRSPLPDQSRNLAIGAGAPTTLAGALARWPTGLHRAVGPYLGQPAFLAGLAGLATAAWADRRARALGLWALVHLALVSLAFANPRLLLPTLLITSLGLPWLALRHRWGRAAVLVAAVGWAAAALPDAWEIDAEEAARDAAVATVSTGPGPVLSTDPWIHRRAGGALAPSVPVRSLGGDVRQLDPDQLAAAALRAGFAQVVLDRARVRRTYPGLAPLLAAPASHGALTLRARHDRYLIYAVVPPAP